MFSFLQRNAKSFQLHAPAPGNVLPLANVPDAAFAGNLLGEGFAVEPEGHQIFSPCDGTIALIAPTKHAIALITENGLEILVHVGLDTVELNGEGFEIHVQVAQKVNKGELLLSFDPRVLTAHNKSSITPVVVTNSASKVQKAVFSTNADAKAPCCLTLE